MSALDWTIAGVQGALLLAALTACVLSWRRLGPSSRYGQLFTLNTLGLWLLFCGFLFKKFRFLVLGDPAARPDLGDVPYLASYVCMAASFAVLATRMRHRDGRGARLGVMFAAMVGTGGTIAAGIALLATRAAPGALTDPYVWLGLAYGFVNGFAIAAVALAGAALGFTGRGAFSRFYALFAVAVATNAAADIVTTPLAAAGVRPVAVDLMYAAAGVLLVAAFTVHAVRHGRIARAGGDAVDAYFELEVPEAERALLAFVAAHRPLIGGDVDAVLRAGLQRAEQASGRTLTLTDDGRVLGPTSQADWLTVLSEVRDSFREEVGRGATRNVQGVVNRFGDRYGFLAA